jgi:DNA polymerase III subunit epsilon
MSKVLWLDTETTGLTASSTIIQIAGIIVIDGKEMERFNLKCRPFKGSEINPEALEVTGLTEAEIMLYPDPVEQHQKLTEIFGKYINKFNKADKFILAGHNVSFDLAQMIRWFNKCNDKYLGSYIDFKRTLDTNQLFRAFQLAGVFPELENTKLSTIAEYFHIEFDAHDAVADVEATRKIGNIMIRQLKRLKKED